MIIKFNLDENIYNENILYYGNKSRYSTLTSVYLLNDNLIVASSFYSRKLYLISFDISKDTYTILYTIDSIGYTNNPVSSDLIDFNGDFMVLSNLNDCSVSLYKIKDNKISYYKSIQNKKYGLCHGVKFHPLNKDEVFIATSGTSNKKCGIYGFKITEDIFNQFISISENNLLGKDVCFTSDGKYLFATFSESAPLPFRRKPYSSKVVVYNVEENYNKITELFIKDSHLDCIQIQNDNMLYITTEELNKHGYIYEIRFVKEENRLEICRKLGNFNFPHGLCINDNLVAITEYGNNSINIINKNDFFN